MLLYSGVINIGIGVYPPVYYWIQAYLGGRGA